MTGVISESCRVLFTIKIGAVQLVLVRLSDRNVEGPCQKKLAGHRFKTLQRTRQPSTQIPQVVGLSVSVTVQGIPWSVARCTACHLLDMIEWCCIYDMFKTLDTTLYWSLMASGPL